ncbi:unnamed protein product, partial [Toxocara canis]|uniref:Peptidase A2 domain-containing protein n=1 Tax=Toxocara canis TaxID=6265 RepID=A0A183UWV6_TOXCA
MVDSEHLRAILETQEERQHQMLKAVLETANQQQQALLEQVGRIFSAIGPTASPASAAEFVTNSLSTRLPEFIYDPDNGYTFDVWFNRYEDVIVQDGSTLDEAAKARFIVSKLDAVAYTRFTNHILPKRAPELCYDDTVKTLKELFGHNTPVFARRYNYLRTKRNGESLSDCTGMVNRRHEMAEFNAITPEQMKCLVWICGLHTPDDADIRTLALRKMEDNPQTTLKQLSLEIQQFLQRNGESLSDYTGMVNRRHEMAEFNAITPEQIKCLMEDNPQTTLKQLSLEIQQFLNIRRDAKLLGSPPSLLQPAVNAVTVKKDCVQNPPSPCFRCGGSQWARNCYFIDKTCHNCKRIGHKKGYCKNFTNKRSRNRKKSRATSNVVVIASTGTDVAPVNRIYRKVKINGATIQMRLDTGADVTLLSIKDWIKINRPKLLPPLVKLKSADNKDIKVRGYFKCDFDINGHKGRGNCYVADTQSLLGLDWIAQNKPLLRRLTEDTICK